MIQCDAHSSKQHPSRCQLWIRNCEILELELGVKWGKNGEKGEKRPARNILKNYSTSSVKSLRKVLPNPDTKS
jgi:hypothetical protein